MSATGPAISRTPSDATFRIGRWTFGPGAALRLAFLLSGLVYLQTIAYGFVYDDFPQIELNAWVHSFKYWRHFFTGHVWSFGWASGNYYRPLFSAWMTADYTLFHSMPGWWHLTSIGAHVVATAMVYLLACRLLRDRWTAVVAAALFGLDPIHVEAVSWVSAVPEILLAIFFIAAFLTFERARERGSRALVYLSAFWYGLALLSKETAVAFLPVLAVWAWTQGHGARSRVLQWLDELAPYALVSAAYAGARILALGGMENPNYPRTWTAVISTWPAALWIYIRGLLWPFPPKPAYDLDLVTSFSFSGVVLPLIAATAGVALIAWLLRKQKLASLAVTWIVMPLVPALIGIRVFQWHDFAHDRYTYIPSVMVAIALAYGLQRASERLGTRRIQLIGTLAIGAAFAATTVMSTGAWDSDMALFARSYRTAPHNPLAGVDLAQAYYTDGRMDDCIALLQTVLKTRPDYWEANYILGLTYYRMGRFVDAEPYLQKATRVWTRQFVYPDGAQFYYLGIVQEHNGKDADAEKSLRKAIIYQPHALSYRYELALILDRLGKQEEAKEQLRIEANNRRLYTQKQQAFNP